MWKAISGILLVELVSAEIEAALTAINAAQIEIIKIDKLDTLVCKFWIYRKDYAPLNELCKKRSEGLKILNTRGLYWWIVRLTKRPVIAAFSVFLMTVTLILPTRVLLVQVEGNKEVSVQSILAAAESCGIKPGTARKVVRSEKMKNALLEALPKLAWAGINTQGCVAIISVRERSENVEKEEKCVVGNIVAACDGYILSGSVNRGSAMFQTGETVTKGQVLISGYTDCGRSIQAESAEGEIIAQTNRMIEAVTPKSYQYKKRLVSTKYKISLVARKKRIKLWKDSGISGGSCGRMYTEYYVTLPGGFQLPIGVEIESYTLYECEAAAASKQEVKEQLMLFADSSIMKQMIAGKILNRYNTFSESKGTYCLNGNYICTEMIGRLQPEQIGEIHGKID